jgi:hypothetical protein
MEFATPFAALIEPELLNISRRQFACLRSTLVCAYVRPDDVNTLEAYAAFRGPQNQQLRDACLAARKALLTHDARYMIDMDDAKQADPVFAEALRASGVRDTPALKKNQRARPGYDAIPEVTLLPGSLPPLARPPGGGIPFDHPNADDRPGRTGRRTASGAGVVVGFLVAGGLYAATRRSA